ncbi:MAG: hypothetical protein HYU88_02115 [Chloroflexi bacterium]|nr:hypothetical protein [Chloroflexota bacterium]MBI4507410.1 hypothetical protein [Chloroflexota bacterium]
MTVLGRLVLLLLAVALQAAWPRALRPAGVTPDLALAVVLAYAMAGGPGVALAWATVGGTLLDLLSSLPAATNLLSHLAGAGVVTLAALGQRDDRPWLVLALPPLGTIAAYAVAGLRLHLAGSSEVWAAVLATLPTAVVLVCAALLGGWLLGAWLRTLRRRRARLSFGQE